MGKKKKKEGVKAFKITTKVKTKCCNKYKKSESKRCKKCPCFDLLKKVA